MKNARERLWQIAGLVGTISIGALAQTGFSQAPARGDSSVPSEPKNQVAKEISAALMQYAAALKRKDVDAAMTLYSPDFKQVTSKLKPVNDKSQLRQVLNKLVRQTASFEVTPSMVRYSGPKNTRKAKVFLGLHKKVTHKLPLKGAPRGTSIEWSSIEVTDWVKTRQGWKLKFVQQIQDEETNQFLLRVAH